jgi:transitional endoplasmic reticulum ATPase
MLPTLLLLATAGLIIYLAVALAQHRSRAARERRVQQFMAARTAEALGLRGAGQPPSAPAPAEEVLEEAEVTDSRRFQDQDGNWVEVTRRESSFPGGSFSVTSSRQTVGVLEDPAQDDGERFPVVSAAELPTFADVGGMEPFKAEVAETLGLILQHGDGARAYGITWNGVLLHGPPGVGKTFLARAVAGEYGLNLLHVSTGDLVEGVVGHSARNVQRVFTAAADNRPCLLFFDEFDSVAQRRDGGTHAEERRTVNQLLTSLEASRGTHDLLVMAATNDPDHLDPAVIRPGRFDRHVRIDLPDAAARQAVLVAQLRDRPACGRIELEAIAERTAGLTPAALARIVDVAALQAFRQAAGQGVEVEIGMPHLLAAVEAHGGQDRPTVEDWDWEHLILPAGTKAELRQLQAMLEDADLARSLGVDPPSGVLLAGPPGTGKTTVARVLAAQAKCSFYPVSAADVISKWVGESEGNIRRLFERARSNRPSIIFIDELDAIGTRRGHDSGLGDRQLNQLLVEIDGIDPAAGILVIGATNRPELLDPALLRGGRLSRTIRLELPEIEARTAILRLATARMPTVEVDIDALAAATEGFSGADLKALCQQAAVHALVRMGTDADGAAPPAVLTADFARAIMDRRSAEVVEDAPRAL